ncbi:hypothetical protein [Thalassospira sp.]|uniref:hypothetical protein n=1 Tax=Thalassospira sp. TaxID=1912094 RepID=UPI0027332ABE|nr:hypothetical protein [Thalassospira sp.]MDP2696938.1 hypothetical protein [Thalassospira sp.]
MSVIDTINTGTALATSRQAGLSNGTILSNSTGTANKDDEEQNNDLAYIREHGFTAYVREIEERKIEELRNKILESMGLDEESLAKMDARQRNDIERAISDAITQRLNSASLTTTDDEAENNGQNPAISPAAITFDPRMFDVFTALQSELPDGDMQNFTSDPDKDRNA